MSASKQYMLTRNIGYNAALQRVNAIYRTLLAVLTSSLPHAVMPRFTVQPSPTRAVEGYSAMLHCKATGDPLPTIQWDRNNVLNNFDPQRYRVLENGSLYISEVHRDDDGKYGCTAGNSGGLRRVEASLVVLGKHQLLLHLQFNKACTRNRAK